MAKIYSHINQCDTHVQYFAILLACVTEQTHEIRVYGLCDGVRFAVPHNFAWINYEPKHSVHVHRPYTLCTLHHVHIQTCFFSCNSQALSLKSYAADACIFVTVQIYPWELHKDGRIHYLPYRYLLSLLESIGSDDFKVKLKQNWTI